jgi:hypothetical protein
MKRELTEKEIEAFIKMDQAFWYAMYLRQRRALRGVIIQMTLIGSGFVLQIMGIIPWWLQLINVLASGVFVHVHYKHYEKIADEIYNKAKEIFNKETSSEI